MKAVLLLVTRHGPSVLAGGVLLGLAWPGLATLARPLMPATVFVFMLGTLLRVDTAELRAALARPRVSMLLPLFVMVACPVVVGILAQLAGVDPALRLALVLATAAPPSSGTAAVARMLGLDPAVPLVATFVSMAAAPLTVPLLVGLANEGGPLPIGPLDLAWRLALLVGSAEGVALFLRQRAARLLAEHGLALDGLIIVALLVFALATMAGVRTMIEAAPARALGFVLLAYSCNIGLQLLAAAVFPGDTSARAAIGLTAGNRNVGLVWAALGTATTPTMALLFAAAQLPIYTLPRAIQAFLGRPRQETKAASKRASDTVHAEDGR